MTEKQENILKAALKLFANEGYASTSTSKVAKAAGVSEGLIFRHFKNKEGLLEAIMLNSAEAAKKMLSDVVMTSEPKEVIRKILELPYNIDKKEYEMWRLTYALKWQTDSYSSEKYNPVRLVLKNAFDQLGYENPEAEVELVFILMDGAATAILLHEPTNKNEILKALKSKYKL
jgi:AcrR family transcriptional regulator